MQPISNKVLKCFNVNRTQNVHTYKSHGFIRPDRQFQAQAIHDPCCAHCRNQDQTRSTNPRQDHANCGHPVSTHPVSIVLPVCDGVNDFEVAFQSDDHQTEDTGSDAKRRQTRETMTKSSWPRLRPRSNETETEISAPRPVEAEIEIEHQAEFLALRPSQTVRSRDQSGFETLTSVDAGSNAKPGECHGLKQHANCAVEDHIAVVVIAVAEVDC